MPAGRFVCQKLMKYLHKTKQDTLNEGYFSPPKLGQKVTRAISVRVTGYFFKILSRVTFVVTGYFLAKLSRVLSRVTLAPKIVTGY